MYVGLSFQNVISLVGKCHWSVRKPFEKLQTYGIRRCVAISYKLKRRR